MGCSVSERDVMFHEGDEATTTPARSVTPECCVSRKFRCVVVSCIEFGFLDDCSVYVVFV